MSQPTEAQLVTQWKDAVKVLNEARKFCESNSPNYLGLEQTFVTDIGVASDFGSESLSGMAGLRSRFDAALREAPNVLRPILRQYGALIAAPETDDNAIGQRLYDYYVANAYTIKQRNFTFGSPSAAGGNVGSGSLYRLNKDANNYNIESQNADAKIALCVQDQTTGTNANEEMFEFRGAARFKDALSITGSGEVQRYPVTSASGSLLVNAQFSTFSGTAAAPTAITSWTPSVALIGDGSDVKVDQVNYYRAAPGIATPSSLAILKTITFTQALSVRNTKIDPNRPYFLRIAWKANVATAGVGTLSITLGSQTVSVVVSGQTGWQILKIPVDYHTWYKNWAGNAPTVSVVWTRTSGQINVSDFQLQPMQPMNSSWYALDGGATPFLRGDYFSWSDTEAGTGLLQYWFWRAFGRYLPSAASPTYTDP